MRNLSALARRARLPLSLGCVISVIALGLTSPASGAASWRTVLDEQFNGSALSSSWRPTLGTQYPGGPPQFGTGEVEVNTANRANLRVEGGNLVITPVRDSAGQWTSARIETRNVYKPAAGAAMRIEARLAMPNVTGERALGYWPAFWALGAPYRQNPWSWPKVGEFDLMENVNGINKSWATLHCGVAPGGPCNENIGRSNGGVAPSGARFQGNFHQFAFEWDRSRGSGADELRWYNDGVRVNTVAQSDLPAAVWADMTTHAGYFVILNVAIGGAFPAALGGGPTAATASGVPMKVDYVRVSYRGAAAPSPAPSPTPTPTAPPTTPSETQTAVIQAESYASQSHTSTGPAADQGGGRAVTHIANGSWLGYRSVDFGRSAKSQFVARIASGAADGVSGLVEVHLNNLQSPSIGSFAFASTGGWQSWRTVPANIAPTTGRHDVFLRFVSGAPGDLVNLNKFVFSTTANPHL
jgi:hypothetical protein